MGLEIFLDLLLVITGVVDSLLRLQLMRFPFEIRAISRSEVRAEYIHPSVHGIHFL
jgi:hypothetical protein